LHSLVINASLRLRLFSSKSLLDKFDQTLRVWLILIGGFLIKLLGRGNKGLSFLVVLLTTITLFLHIIGLTHLEFLEVSFLSTLRELLESRTELHPDVSREVLTELFWFVLTNYHRALLRSRFILFVL